jgi:hypothetical protein
MVAATNAYVQSSSWRTGMFGSAWPSCACTTAYARARFPASPGQCNALVSNVWRTLCGSLIARSSRRARPSRSQRRSRLWQKATSRCLPRLPTAINIGGFCISRVAERRCRPSALSEPCVRFVTAHGSSPSDTALFQERCGCEEHNDAWGSCTGGQSATVEGDVRRARRCVKYAHHTGS